MKNQHNTNSSSGRFTTDTPQRENEQTTRSFTMRNMGRGLLLGLSLSIATFSVATAQTGSLQGRRVILNDGGLTTGTFNRIQLNTPADGSLTGDYNLILPPSNGAVDNILFVESVPSAGNSQLNFTSGDQLFWKLKGNNTTFVDGTNNLLGTLTADPLNIITGGTMRIRVTAAGNVGIGAGNAPSQLFAVGGGAGGNLTIDNSGNLVTAGNLTINGTGTNAIGVAATTNTILGTTTVTGNALVNNSGAFTTGIGTGTNTGLVSIGNGAGGGITADAGAGNVVLNNILSAVPAPTDYMVWMTAVGNNVRRTLLSGTADQGLMHEAGQYRLGNSTDGNTPIVSSRFVRVGAAGTLTFNTATTTALVINNGGLVDLNTVGGANTNIGTTGAGTLALRGASITGTAPVMSSTSTTSNDINAATLTLNSTAGYNTNVGNATGTFGLTSTQLNIASATGNISDAVGNVVVADNLDVTGTGTNNIGVAAATNTILGTTGVTGATTINNSGAFTTDIATGTNTGLVTIGNNANGGGVTVSAGTTNLVLNNITIATPAVTDYAVWMTAAGNNVRRQLLSGTADQGLMYEAGQYRLGHSTDGNNPITGARFVRVGGGGTLTFNSGTANMLTLNNNGNVDVSTTGTGVTTIGNATGGNVSVLSAGTIAATGTTNINTTGNAVTTIGSLANTGGTNIRANGTITIDVNNVANNVVMNNIATGVNSNDVMLINASNQVRRLASNQFAWLITGNGHVVTDNVNNLLGTTTAADLRVITNNVTRMVVNGTGGPVAVGNIGIGTSADATYRLAIAPNATGNGVLVTGAPVTGLRIEDPSGTGISVGAAGAPTTGIIVQAGTTGMTIGSVTAPTALGLSVRTAGAANGITVDQSAGSDLVINESSISRTAANIAINPGSGNLVTTDGNVTISGANTNTIGVAGTTNNITGTQNVVGLTNINTGAGTANTNIGNTGAGAGTVTIASGGTNATTIDVGNTGNNLILNNILNANPIQDILWITATNQVRRATFTSTADEGLQFNNSAYRLGHLVDGSAPIVNPRFVRVGGGGTLTFNTGTTTALVINNGGQVDLNNVGGANTNIGTTGSGTITLGGATINATAPTMSSTSTTSNTINAATLTLNNTAGYNTAIGNTTGTFSLSSDQFRVAVNGDLSDNGGNVVVADNLDVTGTGTNNIGVPLATNIILGSTTVTGATDINVTGGSGTNIGTGTNTNSVNIGNNANGGGISMSAGTTNITMTNIANDATPLSMLSLNASNQVRSTALSNMANQGLMYEGGEFRLGHSTNGSNAITSARFVRVGAAGTLTFNTATTTALVINNGGQVDLNNVGGANTNIGTTGSGTITLGGASINATAPTMTSTSTTSNTINAATLTLNSTAGYNTAVGNATGTFGLTSTQLNVASASGELSDLVGAVTVNDVDGFVVNSGGAADVTITETAITRAGAFTVDQGANLLTLGNVGGTVTIGGTAGTANITATSLSTNVAPAFTHPTDGIVIANGSGVLRRRPVTDLINASNGVIYNETGTDAEVRLGTLAAGTGALTNALAGPRFVNLGTLGVLSFNRGAGTNNMLSLNGATGVVTIDGTTTNINTGAGNNTVVGNATGTFGLTSTQLNIASASGELSDAVGAVTVNDAEGLVINTGVPTDLVITETTISRVNADININPGGGNIVNTDGSMYVARNLVVDQTTNLGNGSGADNTTIAAGTGTITLTGTTNINTTGTATTTIGDLANSAAVNVRSQTAVNLLSDGNVNIQTGGNGDVVIGNSPNTQTLTINADIRGTGPNRFAERVLVNGTGVAAYTIANNLATANSVVIITLENYTGGGILSYQLTARAAGSFTVTFSNNILVGETVAVHYMIINP
ncbi:MAG: hypothetical protein JSS89_03440 [Bacteroidetes bacterium]|nr:hypothetical protein [Bacteroidota bacterium]